MSQLSSRAQIVCLFILMAVILVGCEPSSSQEAELTPITLQLSWTHSAQFAGYYAAVENGDYANEGIEITFVEGGPNVDRTNSIVNGEIQFGLIGGNQVLEAREEGEPVRAIATIYRRSPFVFFTLADSGITRPEDFVGKTIQIRARARVILLEMMVNVGIAPELYEEDADAGSDDLFSGEVDVATGWVTSQVLEAKRAGIELNVIYPDDYGVHFFNDSIFSTEDYLAANTDLVTQFLRATLRGWRWAIENPEEAGALVLKYNPDLDLEIQIDQLKASIPLVHTGDDQIGWMRAEIWKDMYDILMEQGLLDESYNVEDVFTMEFLERVYGGEP